MSLNILIASSVPVLTPADSVDTAISIMQDHLLNLLPVVSEEHLLGFVQENDMIAAENQQQLLKDSNLLHQNLSIHIDKHPYEALKAMYELNVTVIPVTDNENKYYGCVTCSMLLKYFSENSLLPVPGGIIVLQIPARSYSLFEIARICENEDVLVLNVQVKNMEGGDLEITLKTNKTILDPVVSSFERHQYFVKEVYSEAINKDDLVNKYNMLMNYINM